MKIHTFDSPIWGILKYTFILIFLFNQHTLKSQSSSSILDNRISISFERTKLSEALSNIEKIANISISYAPNALKGNRRVSQSYTNTTLREILNDLLVEYKIFYGLRGNTVLIRTDAKKGRVTGRVTNANSGPVAFASVILKGTNYGASSDDDGYFSFNAPEGEYIIIASSVGYATVQKSVTIQSDRVMEVRFELQESSQNLDEVIVQANRLTKVGIGDETSFGVLGERAVVNTPFSVIAFTDQLIANSIAQNFNDILLRDPSISAATNDAGPNDIFEIRGFGLARASYLYDGLPGLVITDGFLGVTNLERIEVFRGANPFNNGGSFFGGIGGTINLTPKRPLQKDITNLTIGYQSDQPFFQADISWRFGNKRNLGLRFNGYYASGNGAVDKLNRITENYSLYLDYNPANNLYFALEGTRFRSRSNGYRDNVILGEGVSVPEPPSAEINYAQSWSFIEMSGGRIYAKGVWNFADNWSLNVGGGILDGDQNNGYLSAFGFLDDNEGNLTIVPFATDQPQRNNRGFQTTLNGSFNIGNILNKITVLGSTSVEEINFPGFNSDPISSNLYEPVYVPRPVLVPVAPLEAGLQGKVNSIGVIYEASFLKETVNVMVGARNVDLTLESSSAGNYDRSDTTPFGSIYVNPTKNSTVYASYTEGLERGGSAPGSAVNANEELPPAATQQIEIGGKLDLDGLLLTAAYFDLSRPLNFVNSENVFVADGEQVHRGFEIQASGDVSEKIRVITGVTLLDTELENGNPSIQGNRAVGVADFSASFYGEYDFSQLTITGGIRYQGDQFVNVTNSADQLVDPWTNIDIGARYRFNLSKVKMIARVNVNNVLNEAYWDVNEFSGLVLSNPTVFRASLTAKL